MDLLATPIGIDCAGAVPFCPPREQERLTTRESGIRWQTEHDIAQWIRQARSDWATWNQVGYPGQFSLGRAQAKCALHLRDDRWGAPYGNIPTTHILKPGLAEHEDGEVVEHVCMNAAHHLGLSVARSSLGHFESERALVVERFDRAHGGGGIRRLHQEDLCQALGMSSNEKYQKRRGSEPERHRRLAER